MPPRISDRKKVIAYKVQISNSKISGEIFVEIGIRLGKLENLSFMSQ